MKNKIEEYNSNLLEEHKIAFNHLSGYLHNKGVDSRGLIEKLSAFQIAIPSWALGAGGTRFGRYGFGGEPRDLKEKIADVAVINDLTGSANAVSIHLPWDKTSDPHDVRSYAESKGILFDAVNSNTFQDVEGEKETYKFGSLSDESKAVRDQAIAHNKEVIDSGVFVGSKSLTVWLADGSSYPGQSSFRRALDHTAQSLKEIYAHMPSDWKLFIEYKPYEPYFYHTVIQDWGTSMMLANECGERAYTLVDLGHHLPNTNIENIVSTLIYKGKLGGFHFNDSKYGDDDLTVGSVKPYQLFLIFNELVNGMENNTANNPSPAWMIDASHNLKDPIEDLIQSIEAIMIAYAQALLIDQEKLKQAQINKDVVLCQAILQDAYRTDVRSLVAEARRVTGNALYPISAYRAFRIRKSLIQTRGHNAKATGL